MSGTIGEDSIGGSPQVGGVPKQEEEQPKINLFAGSTIAASQAEQAMKAFLSGYPNLVAPMDPETAKLAVGAQMSRVGLSMWDIWSEGNAKIQQEIKDYLKSPKYAQWLQLRSPAERSKIEDLLDVNIPGDTLAEKVQNNILSIWTNAIEGMNTFVRKNKDASLGALVFLPGSFIVTWGLVGVPVNILNIASPVMGVNPLQNVVSASMALIPAELQLTMALSINLLALSLIAFSNLVVLGGAAKKEPPPVTKDIVLIFARAVLAQARNNVVNPFLMAMLGRSTLKGVPLTEVAKEALIVKAKVIMVAMALAALYVVETGWNSQKEFSDLLNGKMKTPRSEEEALLVSYMQELRGLKVLVKEEWDALVGGLGNYFGKLRSADPLFHGDVFAKIFAHVRPFDKEEGLEG